MRLLYFEIRKNFLRKYFIIVLLCFIILNIVVIYKNYKVGDGSGFCDYVTPNTISKGQWDFYKALHKQLDGKMTSKNLDYIINEYTRLNNIIEKGNYNRDYDEETYTGYTFGDYSIINQYFYEPLKFRATYGSAIQEIADQAQENIKFYQKVENNYEKNKNIFIRNHYNERKITDFYETLNWKKLFDYNFSDLLICILMLLGLTPIFRNEKDTEMYDLINSSKEGKKNMKASKYLASVVFAAFLVIIFSVVNLIAYRYLFRLSGWNQPLYAIEVYQYTPLNCSVLSFYILNNIMKFFGFLMLALLLCYVSKISSHIIWAFIINVLFMVLGIFMSGYYMGIKTLHVYLSIISPFTLLKGNGLFQNLLGMNLGGQFFLRAYACLILQIILLLLFFIRIVFFSKLEKRNWKLKRRRKA